MSPPAAIHLVELDHAECIQLLTTGHLGRVAVNVPGWPPLIRPVNYVFDISSQSVVFRSARGSKLHALAHTQRAAFEVDGEDPGSASGWSVIVIGPVEEIASGADIAHLDRTRLRPWLTDEGAHWMRIRATAISGRRIGPSRG
jgi:uncharacterized protein